MSRAEGKEPEENCSISESGQTSEKGYNSLLESIEEEYDVKYLFGSDTGSWSDIDGSKKFDDLDYREFYGGEDSIVVIFPEFVNSHEAEDIADLTERLLEEGEEIGGLVAPAYDLGRAVYPPRNMELVDSFWNQDSYAGKALLYER